MKQNQWVMNQHLPKPAFRTTRVQMSKEFNMSGRAFKTKLSQVKIDLAPGKIMPDDQMRIYIALGAPLFIWINPHTLVPYSDDLL